MCPTAANPSSYPKYSSVIASTSPQADEKEIEREIERTIISLFLDSTFRISFFMADPLADLDRVVNQGSYNHYYCTPGSV
jgi:hypothetical protein